MFGFREFKSAALSQSFNVIYNSPSIPQEEAVYGNTLSTKLAILHAQQVQRPYL